MSVRSKADLQAAFATNQQPSGQDFADLLDTAGLRGEGVETLLARVTINVGASGATVALSNLSYDEIHVARIVAHSPTDDASGASVKAGTNVAHDNFIGATSLGADLDNSAANQEKRLTPGAGGFLVANGQTMSIEVGPVAGQDPTNVTFDLLGYAKGVSS